MAPERFYDSVITHKQSPETNSYSSLTVSMDIFSLGCSIAELFLDGEVVFTYQELLAYAKGNFDVNQRLSNIQDQSIREMVLHMLNVNPKLRLTPGDYLSKYPFPAVFGSLHTILVEISKLSPDEKIHIIAYCLPQLLKEFQTAQNQINSGPTKLNEAERKSQTKSISKSKSDLSANQSNGNENGNINGNVNGNSSKTSFIETRLKLEAEIRVPGYTSAIENSQNLLSRVEEVTSRLEQLLFSGNEGKDHSDKNFVKPQVLVEGQARNQNVENSQTSQNSSKEMVLEGVVIIATIIFSSMRHLELPSTRLLSLSLLQHLSHWTDDLVRVQRLVPYVMSLFSDPSPRVRASAVEVLTEIMSQVTSMVEGESNIFDEYIFPDLATEIEDEKDDLVLVACGNALGTLAELSMNFLNLSFAVASNQVSVSSSCHSMLLKHGFVGKEGESSTYDEKVHNLRKSVWGIFEKLFNGGTFAVMRSLYNNLTKLCCFFGWNMTLDSVLPQIVFPLNTFGDWQLRAAFFDNIPGVGILLGRARTEEIILPCIFGKIYDPEEFVVERVINCLSSLCEVKLFSNKSLMTIVDNLSPLLCHPNSWIRYNTVALFSIIGRQFDRIDLFSFVILKIRPYLKQDIVNTNEETLLANLIPPMSRNTFDSAVQGGPQDTMFSGSDSILYQNTGMGNYLLYAHAHMQSYTSFNSEQQNATNSERLLNEKKIVDGLKQYTMKVNQTSPGMQNRTAKLDILNFVLQIQHPENDNDQENNQFSHPSFRSLNASTNLVLIPTQAQQEKMNEEIDVDGSMEDGNFVFAPLNASMAESGWKPKGVFLTQLHDHSQSVTALRVSYKDKFFASASDDGTVKIWSPERISKRDSTHLPSLTHSLGSRVTALALSSTSYSVACASVQGVVRIFDVEEAKDETQTQENLMKFQLQRQVDVQEEGHVLAMSLFANNLIFVTHNNIMRFWDTRMRNDALYIFDCPPLHMGLAQDLLVDPAGNWVLIGTSLGFLIIYDIRFEVIGKVWRHPKRCPIRKLSHFNSNPNFASQSSIRPPEGPLVLIAAGGSDSELCAVWDIASGHCCWSFQSLGPKETPLESLDLTECDLFISGTVNFWKNNEAYRHLEGREDDNVTYPHYTRALYYSSKGSFLMTGGSDRTLRFWDLEHPAESFQVVSPRPEIQSGFSQNKGTKSHNYDAKAVNQTTVRFTETPVVDTVFSSTQSKPMIEESVSTAHRGCITDIAVVTHPNQSRLLLTSGRDGVVRVYR
eukprot:c20652_g1_i1.p1 GENE.c20652_g1_i1~~c20652_g1_i1.p1  ORF type:complete len:1457 (+),score=612.94 c20652_g1_i1:607-4371(+)